MCFSQSVLAVFHFVRDRRAEKVLGFGTVLVDTKWQTSRTIWKYRNSVFGSSVRRKDLDFVLMIE